MHNEELLKNIGISYLYITTTELLKKEQYKNKYICFINIPAYIIIKSKHNEELDDFKKYVFSNFNNFVKITETTDNINFDENPFIINDDMNKIYIPFTNDDTKNEIKEILTSIDNIEKNFNIITYNSKILELERKDDSINKNIITNLNNINNEIKDFNKLTETCNNMKLKIQSEEIKNNCTKFLNVADRKLEKDTNLFKRNGNYVYNIPKEINLNTEQQIELYKYITFDKKNFEIDLTNLKQMISSLKDSIISFIGTHKNEENISKQIISDFNYSKSKIIELIRFDYWKYFALGAGIENLGSNFSYDIYSYIYNKGKTIKELKDLIIKLTNDNIIIKINKTGKNLIKVEHYDGKTERCIDYLKYKLNEFDNIIKGNFGFILDGIKYFNNEKIINLKQEKPNIENYIEIKNNDLYKSFIDENIIKKTILSNLYIIKKYLTYMNNNYLQFLESNLNSNNLSFDTLGQLFISKDIKRQNIKNELTLDYIISSVKNFNTNFSDINLYSVLNFNNIEFTNIKDYLKLLTLCKIYNDKEDLDSILQTYNKRIKGYMDNRLNNNIVDSMYYNQVYYDCFESLISNYFKLQTLRETMPIKDFEIKDFEKYKNLINCFNLYDNHNKEELFYFLDNFIIENINHSYLILNNFLDSRGTKPFAIGNTDFQILENKFIFEFSDWLFKDETYKINDKNYKILVSYTENNIFKSHAKELTEQKLNKSGTIKLLSNTEKPIIFNYEEFSKMFKYNYFLCQNTEDNKLTEITLDDINIDSNYKKRFDKLCLYAYYNEKIFFSEIDTIEEQYKEGLKDFYTDILKYIDYILSIIDKESIYKLMLVHYILNSFINNNIDNKKLDKLNTITDMTDKEMLVNAINSIITETELKIFNNEKQKENKEEILTMINNFINIIYSSIDYTKPIDKYINLIEKYKSIINIKTILTNVFEISSIENVLKILDVKIKYFENLLSLCYEEYEEFLIDLHDKCIDNEAEEKNIGQFIDLNSSSSEIVNIIDEYKYFLSLNNYAFDNKFITQEEYIKNNNFIINNKDFFKQYIFTFIEKIDLEEKIKTFLNDYITKIFNTNETIELNIHSECFMDFYKKINKILQEKDLQKINFDFSKIIELLKTNIKNEEDIILTTTDDTIYDLKSIQNCDKNEEDKRIDNLFINNSLTVIDYEKFKCKIIKLNQNLINNEKFDNVIKEIISNFSKNIIDIKLIYSIIKLISNEIEIYYPSYEKYFNNYDYIFKYNTVEILDKKIKTFNTNVNYALWFINKLMFVEPIFKSEIDKLNLINQNLEKNLNIGVSDFYISVRKIVEETCKNYKFADTIMDTITIKLFNAIIQKIFNNLTITTDDKTILEQILKEYDEYKLIGGGKDDIYFIESLNLINFLNLILSESEKELINKYLNKDNKMTIFDLYLKLKEEETDINKKMIDKIKCLDIYFTLINFKK